MLDSGFRSLQDMIDCVPDLVTHFRNTPVAPHNRNKPGPSPVPAEFSIGGTNNTPGVEWPSSSINPTTCQSCFSRAPIGLEALQSLGINSLANFAPGLARQYVGVNHDGNVIGESIMHCLGSNRFELISGMHLQDWVAFNATAGGYDVSVTRDYQTSANSEGRTNFRFGIDPQRQKIFHDVITGDAPKISFFHTAMVEIGWPRSDGTAPWNGWTLRR